MPYTNAIIPLRGWITDTAYSGVPEGYTHDILNVMPSESFRRRVRLGTRPGFNRMYQFASGAVQGMVRTTAFAGTPPVITERLLVVNQGKIWTMLPGQNPTTQVVRISDNSTTAPLVTSGPVEAVQRGRWAYFVDGTNYIRVDLFLSTPKWELWTHGGNQGANDLVTNTVGGVAYKATKIALFGTRIALAGVRQKENLWWMSGVEDPDHFAVTTDPATAIAGNDGTWGVPGDEIVALIPFGRGAIIFAGKKSMSMLTSDPVFGQATIQQMSRTVGIVGPRAWCNGPEQSIYIMAQDGIYRLSPNDFNIDRGNLVSLNKLDAFFNATKWDDIDCVLSYDVERRGLWAFMTRTDQPASSTHIFYSEQTDGFFPYKMYDPLFRGAYSASQMITTDGRNQVSVFGSTSGMMGFFDQKIISGIDGYSASGYSANGLNPATVAAATAQRIVSQLTVGPIVSSQPGLVFVREVQVELGADDYLEDASIKGIADKPLVQLLTADTAQEAIAQTVVSLRVDDEATITADGGTPSLAGDAQVAPDYNGGNVATDAYTDYLDGQYVPVQSGTYTTQDTFVAELSRVYEDDSSTIELSRRDVTISGSTTNRWVIRFQDSGSSGQLGRVIAVQNISNGSYSEDPTVGEYYAVVTDGDFDGAAGNISAVLNGTGGLALVQYSVNAADFADLTITDLGNITNGANNRLRCRVRANAAFLRFSSSGYPFAMERVGLNVDPVGPRRTVIDVT